VDKPMGSVLDSRTGAFVWTPQTPGEFNFIVTASSGPTATPLKVTLVVAPDRPSALKLAVAGFDPNSAYVAEPLARYQIASAGAQSDIASVGDAEFQPRLDQLHDAVKSLQLLTPRLPDGSMDFPKVVAASSIGESIGLLVDGNDDTFPVYTLAKDLNYTFDFGPDYTFNATAFAMEGRLNFEDRMANSRFFGSNDGTNWVELTTEPTRLATELSRIEVSPAQTNATFRFLRIQKRGGGLFEPSELRIYGRRQEAGLK